MVTGPRSLVIRSLFLARAARERKSEIDGTMFSREGRKTWAFGVGIVPRLFHATRAGLAGGFATNRAARSQRSLGESFSVEREK
jgi:hypothetical protein